MTWCAANSPELETTALAALGCQGHARAMIRCLTGLLLLALCAFPASAKEERVLDRVFLVRDKPGTPMRFEMVVNAGCNDEANGDCRGLAHYLEHLILVGRNPDHEDSAFRFFADAGSNGWTNARATAYLHTVPARPQGPAADVERLFQFYAARLKDFSVTEADAARERNVVLQEHDTRVQSSKPSLFWRDLTRQMIPDHPSGQWTIGTRETIQSLTLDEARAFHQAWYGPNNVWFVVRADMEPEALKAIAERALAGIPARPLSARNFDKLPGIPGGRTDARRVDPAVARASVSVSKLVTIPAGGSHANRAARALLMAWFNSQLAGTPYDKLVEENEIALDRVGVGLSLIAPDTFRFNASAEPADGVAPDALREALVDWMGRLAERGPPAQAVLDRLRLRMTQARAAADKEPRQVHQRLVGWLAEGLPYEELDAWPERLAAVTPETLAPILKALAGPGRIVTGIYEPAGKP